MTHSARYNRCTQFSKLIGLHKSIYVLTKAAKLVSEILKSFHVNEYGLNHNILPLSLHGLKIVRDNYMGLSGKLQVIKPL